MKNINNIPFEIISVFMDLQFLGPKIGVKGPKKFKCPSFHYKLIFVFIKAKII